MIKDIDNKEFSQLCHNYYKLASMKIMQYMREKYDIPEDEIYSLNVSIYARLLNEGVYSVGAQLMGGFDIFDIYSKEHLFNLLKVLNNEPLNQLERTDIKMKIDEQLEKFRKFVKENSKDFNIN